MNTRLTEAMLIYKKTEKQSQKTAWKYIFDKFSHYPINKKPTYNFETPKED